MENQTQTHIETILCELQFYCQRIKRNSNPFQCLLVNTLLWKIKNNNWF